MEKDKNSRCFRHSNKEEIYWHVRPSLIGRRLCSLWQTRNFGRAAGPSRTNIITMNCLFYSHKNLFKFRVTLFGNKNLSVKINELFASLIEMPAG